MNHQFDVEIAKDYGIEEAILINHFQFWIAKNRANERHFHDGRTWTYNSIRAFQELFPYMTAKTVKRTVERLITLGILIKAEFNTAKWDRTGWYAFSDESAWLSDLPKMANGLAQNGILDLPKRANGDAQKGNSTGTSDNHMINNGDTTTAKQRAEDLELPQSLSSSEIFCETWRSWLADRRDRKQPVTIRGAEMQLRKLVKMGLPKATEALEASIANGWRGIFEPRSTVAKHEQPKLRFEL